MSRTQFLGCLALLAMIGCNSVNKGTVAKVQLGMTTDAEVVKIFGNPRGSAEFKRSGTDSRTYIYHDCTTGNIGPAVIGNYYWLGVETENGVVTAFLYVRSDGGNATHFDASKFDRLIEGQTTKEDALALLGTPSGRAMLPSRLPDYANLNMQQGIDVLSWSDAEPIHGMFFADPTHIKILKLQFGSDDLLTTKSIYGVAVTPNVWAR